jgi:hypothetical protein
LEHLPNPIEEIKKKNVQSHSDILLLSTRVQPSNDLLNWKKKKMVVYSSA